MRSFEKDARTHYAVDALTTGSGTAAPSRVPVKVAGDARLATLSAGGAHACGFDEGVWCWGANAYGQLGVAKDSVAAAPAPLKVRRSPPE